MSRTERTEKVIDDDLPLPIPMDKFIGSGVLWAINKHLLHPRGFALAIALDSDREPVGWNILGDGTEPWHFDTDEPEATKFEALLDSLRPEVGHA